jgi:hypothetical protein
MQQLGEELARTFSYECPDKRCGVAVYPSFPDKKKPGRIKAPRPYFSARAESHKEFCRRDDPSALEEHSREVRETELVSPEFEALLADYPEAFDESEHRGARGETQRERGTDDSPPREGEGGRKRRSSGEGGAQERQSIRGSRHLKKFVRVYESFPALREHLPIRIRYCPGRTYKEAFLSVAEGVDERGVAAARHIFFGGYQRHVVRLSGTAVYFRVPEVNGKPFGIWIPNGLVPERLMEVITGRLRRAIGEPEAATVYALGRFKLFGDWKYSFTISKLGHLWISFPDDYT